MASLVKPVKHKEKIIISYRVLICHSALGRRFDRNPKKLILTTARIISIVNIAFAIWIELS
jgi:hypothetical protein